MTYLALSQSETSSIPQYHDYALENGFNAIVMPINYTELPMDLFVGDGDNQHTEYSYADMLLTPDQWNVNVILQMSDEIDCDSSNLSVRRKSEQILKRDISWASHLQNTGHILVRLKSGNNCNLARIASSNIKGMLLVQVPLYVSKIAQAGWRTDVLDDDMEQLQQVDTWHWWNDFRRVADYDPKIKVVLELNEMELPNDETIRRWLGEPIEAIIISSDMFITNRSNYPVLRKSWQRLLGHFLAARVNIIVRTEVQNKSLKMYTDYLLSLKLKYKDTHSLENFEDVLEVPLQPLNNNLDCYTYDVFEKDPVKYKLYQDAIEAALCDRVQQTEIDTKLSIIMVLGAGRGPLVRSALNAAAKTNRKVRIYIIEKNPNAIRTLHGIVKKLWHDKDVHLFSKDMREFMPPEKADILVSELLGSFGDNELSPECLDCAQKLLKADGISIPCKSTSYINPLMSSKLVNCVRNIVGHTAFTHEKVCTTFNHFETGYVALLKNVYHIDQPQALFEFVHPNHSAHIDNSRYKLLSFKADLDCMMTGIAGYFDTVLYKNIIYSINPLTHTMGLSSWFPMFFPLTEPIVIRKNDTIDIQFWRCVSTQKVWYEWCISSPTVTHIHNLNGRSCAIYCS